MSNGYSVKKLSAAAIVALKDALTNIYWYKNDLRGFLTNCLSDPTILSRLNWKDYKHVVVSNLINFLTRQEGAYQGELIHLMEEVVSVNDFTHLAHLEDGKIKVKRAEASVKALKEQVKGHQEIVTKAHELKKAKEAASLRRATLDSAKKALEDLNTEYMGLIGTTEPQKRGFRLEKIMYGLFRLFDLDPKASFKVEGEQIDGAFTFESTDYLLEAKWQEKLITASDIDPLLGKLSRRLDNTLGLYLSVNGYSEDAVSVHSSGRRLILLMDGTDLMAVLEGRIDFVRLLLRKRRAAAQTGNIYLKVQEILYGKNER